MKRFEGTQSYVATDDLKVAVNAAVTLRRPLLVKGEPGTGKTVLAYEIAKATGAVAALVQDWTTIRLLLDHAAQRFGVEPVPAGFPSLAETASSVTMLGSAWTSASRTSCKASRKDVRLNLPSAVEKISRSTPTLSLNIFGSAEATIMVPSGTPISPPIRNGQTSERSKLFHIDGNVDVCATTEQISTSGTASEGGRT